MNIIIKLNQLTALCYSSAVIRTQAIPCSKTLDTVQRMFSVFWNSATRIKFQTAAG